MDPQFTDGNFFLPLLRFHAETMHSIRDACEPIRMGFKKVCVIFLFVLSLSVSLLFSDLRVHQRVDPAAYEPQQSQERCETSTISHLVPSVETLIAKNLFSFFFVQPEMTSIELFTLLLADEKESRGWVVQSENLNWKELSVRLRCGGQSSLTKSRFCVVVQVIGDFIIDCCCHHRIENSPML